MNEKYLSYFTEYLLDIKLKHTEGTFNFYRGHLLHIGKYLYNKKINNLEEIDNFLIVDYINFIKLTVTNSTINKRVGILKRCFIFYKIELTYLFEIDKFKERKTNFTMVSDVDIKRIIKYIDDLPSKENNNLLYKGIIHIFINTGVRLNELYNIKKRNVNAMQNEILLTKTKSGIDRVVVYLPIIDSLISQLIKDNKSKYLLFNKLKNRPVNYADIKWLFIKIKKDLKIKKLHPHMFRHSYATKLLQYGVDIKSVMDFMGHTNLTTTQKYQHSSKEHAKKSYLEKYKY